MKNTKFKSSKQGIIDQDIFIMDILVYHEVKSEDDDKDLTMGESARPSFSSYSQKINFKERLFDHIALLAHLANQVHQQYYCTLVDEEKNGKKKYKIKDDCRNKITRLALNEFALYPNIPLSLTEFNELVGKIEELASQCHDNVHLVLSSMPVISENKEILNTCLYVQCGSQPVINSFCKGQAFEDSQSFVSDFEYSGTQLFQQKKNPDPDKIFGQFTISPKNGVISHDGILEIKTLGGSRYTQAIDICLDYACKRSKNILSMMRQFSSDQYSLDFPQQVDHLVTANSILLDDSCNITPSVVLVDPRSTAPHMPKLMDFKQASFLVDFKFGSLEYKETYLELSAEGCFIKNPPFGHESSVKIYQERQLDSYKENSNTQSFFSNIQNHPKEEKDSSVVLQVRRII